MPSFSKRSRANLVTANEELQRLFIEVVKEFDCSVLCGFRGKEEQNLKYENGESYAKWGESKHNKLLSDAVDVVPYPIDWEDKNRFFKFAAFVLDKAMEMNIRIRWGGFFVVNGKPFFDAAHFELIRRE